jgi:L-lactate dehydrogenase complex protein LldG
MGSREEILSALRGAAAPAQSLPDDRPVAAVRYPDPLARLAEAVQAVGGGLVRVSSSAELTREIAALADRVRATRIVSEVAEAGAGTLRLSEVSDPHDLEGVQLAVLPGAFAVAENGAVWLPGATLRHRGIFVIVEHLALVVRADAILNDMHEAYARLSFDGPGFGVFIDGPSKTADIEQALVIGAHGPRSCTLFVVG